jgi:hypothetical protein
LRGLFARWGAWRPGASVGQLGFADPDAPGHLLPDRRIVSPDFAIVRAARLTEHTATRHIDGGPGQCLAAKATNVLSVCSSRVAASVARRRSLAVLPCARMMDPSMAVPVSGEVWGEHVEAVRAFFLSEAEQPLNVLRTRLAAARADFRATLEDVTDEQAKFAPPGGEGEEAWGIAEVAWHIASVEPIMAERVRLIGTGQSAEGIRRTHPGYLADVNTRHIADLLQALDESQAALESAIADIEGHEQLDTLAEHRRFGKLNCRGWVALHTLHLRDHARQIERIKQWPEYSAAGSGPTR